MNKPVAWIGETLMGRQYINGSDGLLPVGTPLYTHPVKEQKCIVKDCENHKHEGDFVGDLCKPCHQFITTGDGIYSQAYRNTNPVKELTLTPDEIFDVWDEHTDYDGNFVTSIDDFAKAILRKAQER